MVCEYKIEEYLVYKFILPVIDSNMYVIISDDNALIFDPHVNTEVSEMLKLRGVKKLVIVLTHEHIDHISGVNYYRELFLCKVLGNSCCMDRVKDSKGNLAAFFDVLLMNCTQEETILIRSLLDKDYVCYVDEAFDDEITVVFNDLKLRLIETPGHSLGSICILVNDRYIFTGDTVVWGNKIITCLPGGSRKRYLEVTKLFWKI